MIFLAKFESDLKIYEEVAKMFVENLYLAKN